MLMALHLRMRMALLLIVVSAFEVHASGTHPWICSHLQCALLAPRALFERLKRTRGLLQRCCRSVPSWLQQWVIPLQPVLRRLVAEMLRSSEWCAGH
jgi:hypothetical protein